MDTDELVAYAIFGGYFGIIALSFGFVVASILSSRPFGDLLWGRPSIFGRAALGGLLCTWYFMFKFMQWSYNGYAKANPDSATIGQWLVHTSLFEQAWRAVCVGELQWWWSSWICTSAVFLCAIIWYQCSLRGIKYAAAYMIFGQLVAISVALALFLTAVYMHSPVSEDRKPRASPVLYVPLLASMAVMVVMPSYANTPAFMQALMAIHLGVLIPLFFTPKSTAAPNSPLSISFKLLTITLVALGVYIHVENTRRVIPTFTNSIDDSFFWNIVQVIFSHPAQGSVSLDVVWVAIDFVLWFMVTGSTLSIIAKTSSVFFAVAYAVCRYFEVSKWILISLIPISILLLFGTIGTLIMRARSRNEEHRAKILGELGIHEFGVIPGTDTEPPRVATKRLVVGYWHPYCNAGGGGERVLWNGINFVQRKYPDVISLVYTGDYPEVSKSEILGNIKTRFGIELDPATIQFVPLPSRYLISDTYWTKLTLLGQSLGSIYLAYEGLVHGVWGDVFIDTMGYAFVLPFVRFLTGTETAIGSYTHYPTVSADMVNRVRQRVEGVESGGAHKSALRTRAKLMYYSVFTELYSLALLYSEYTMTNSSWTQAHIKSLIHHGRTSVAASLLLLDDKSREMSEKRGEASPDYRPQCEVVYPACDTKELAKLGGLANRNRELVSLAQFRPEKDQAKQIRALSILFKEHPEYKDGPKAVHLTLMGGARGPPDLERVEGLKRLAKELGVEESVTFLVNAPYSEVVKRLGQASIGLNTMQDEHFGINVVEFMAAGLIPVVHESAGPYLDIVVPYNGQRTGFHAKDAESFAKAIHSALSLPNTQQVRMRKAARALAQEKFSEAAFEKGFDVGFRHVAHLASVRGYGFTEEETQDAKRREMDGVRKSLKPMRV